MVTLILISIAAVAKAVMDKLQFHYGLSIFSRFENQYFWNPNLSWMNKWKDGERKNGEKFPGSSTIFVFTTDAWHLFQAIMLTCLFAAIVTYNDGRFGMFIDFILLRVVFGLVFELFFSKAFEK